jgi:hypothetical protein
MSPSNGTASVIKDTIRGLDPTEYAVISRKSDCYHSVQTVFQVQLEFGRDQRILSNGRRAITGALGSRSFGAYGRHRKSN